MSEDRKWHVDRGVPVALIITLALQFGGGIWYAAVMSARVENLERHALASAPLAERLTRVEEKVTGAVGTLTRIEWYIRRDTRPQAP